MANQIELQSDFEAPALRAGLDVTLILAHVLHGAFEDPNTIIALEQSNVGYIKVATILGSILSERLPRFANKGEIEDVWIAFFIDPDIKYLQEESRSILQRIRDESIELAQTKADYLDYLVSANEKAQMLVESILAEQGLKRLMPSTSVPIEVKNDMEGSGYSCATSRLTQRISWSYQAVPHVLIGLTLADLLFSHEYLSHLVPQNPLLDHTIREQWLVAALIESLREKQSYMRWKLRLWPVYRRMLQDHVRSGSDVRLVQAFGYEGVEEACALLYVRDSELFWRLTVEILDHSSDEDHAKLAAAVAYGLIGQDPRVLSKHNPKSLKDFEGIFRA